MKRFVAAVVSSVLVSLAWAPTAFGGGAMLYEVGSPDVATASAGRAALAEDASTAMLNPAAMTRLDRSELLIGLQPFVLDFRFEQDPGTSLRPPEPEEYAMSPRSFTTKDPKTTKGKLEDLLFRFLFHFPS